MVTALFRYKKDAKLLKILEKTLGKPRLFNEKFNF